MSERDGLATIETAWRGLTAALEGEVVLPGSPRYDEVRRPQIPRFHDVRPRAVVLCRTPASRSRFVLGLTAFGAALVTPARFRRS